MVDFLVLMVKLGKITIEQVPEKYRTAVLALIPAEEVIDIAPCVV